MDTTNAGRPAGTPKPYVATPACMAAYRVAQQCHHLLDVLLERMGDAEVKQGQSVLLGLAHELSNRLYEIFWCTDFKRQAFNSHPAESALSGLAGRLNAACKAMADAGSMPRNGDTVGWLHAIAYDLASDLVDSIEEALDGSIPPSPLDAGGGATNAETTRRVVCDLAA